MTLRKVMTHTSKLGQMYAFIPSLGIIAETDREINSMDIPDGAIEAHKDVAVEFRMNAAREAKTTMIHLVPTGKCMGGCSYCYAMEEWENVKYITRDGLDDALKLNGIDKRSDKIDSFHIYGGEPLIDMDAFIDIMKYIESDYPMATTGISTGLMIEEAEFSKFLTWLAFDAPSTFSISLSMDAYEEGKKYTRRRWGNDTYEILLARLRKIKEVTSNVGLRMTLTMNGSNPFPLLRQLEQEYGEPFSVTMEMEDTDRFAVSREQLDTLLHDLKSYVEDILVPFGAIGSNDPDVHHRFNFDPLANVFTMGSFTNGSRSCPAGSTSLSINPDGGTSGCSRVVELGREKDYSKLKESDIERYLDPTGLPCDTCEYFASCGGGCAEALRLSWKEGVPQSCNWRMEVLDYAAKLLITEGHQDMIDDVRNTAKEITFAVESMIRGSA